LGERELKYQTSIRTAQQRGWTLRQGEPLSVLQMGRYLSCFVFLPIFIWYTIRLQWPNSLKIQTNSGQRVSWLAMIATVLLSILQHGVSANPGIKLHARQLADRKKKSQEQAEIGTIYGK